MAIKISPGIDGIPTTTIPDDPAQFVSWFKSVALKRWFANADVRNANQGAGITITGSNSTPATISVASELTALLGEPFLLVGAPIAGAPLTDYREIAAQSGVLSITDGGPTHSLTVGVTANGIGNAQIRQGAATSVVGNATALLANVADIAATADGQALMRSGGVLAFATPAYPIGANPSATIGLSVNNGSATTFMRSDATPALGVAISPTWTGNHTFSPASGYTEFNGVDNSYAVELLASTNSGKSFGLFVAAGTTSADVAIRVTNSGATVNFLEINGDGSGFLGSSATTGITWTSAGAMTVTGSTLNIGGTYTIGLTANASVGGTNTGDQTIPVGANPSASVGLTAANGSAATFMRSDGAPALSVAIAPTWTKNHIFSPTSGTTTFNGVDSTYAATVIASTTSGKSYGLIVEGGTTSADTAVRITNSGATANFLYIYGDGSIQMGAAAGTSGITLDASGNLTALNNTTLTTGVKLGTAAAKTVGFYGATPAAQRATTSAHSTTNVVTSSAYNSTAQQKIGAILQEVMNTLFTIGIWSDH